MKKKRFFIGVLASLLLIAAVGIFFAGRDDVLTEAQVQALRSEYPICDGVPPGMSVRKVALQECVDSAESFVYAEATGEVGYYNVAVDLENEELEEKRRENGIDDIYTFYEYTLTVLDDSEGVYQAGDTITIAANALFEDYYPKLEEGMRVVVPVVTDEEAEGRCYYTVNGMYYVTGNGYALSAFAQEPQTKSARQSGVRVETLLNVLKKEQ